MANTAGLDILQRLGLWQVNNIAGNKPQVGSQDLSKGLTAEEILAHQNQDEADGESLCSFTIHGHCKHKKKLKSGMLDKATASISHKEIWPQKNLLEDLADADLEFKQLQFEQFVAGEIRTIEVCLSSTEIKGRLQLLRRMAYLKVRGNDWNLVITMHAAIVRSIETGENSWSSNFDRFENILNRKKDPPKDKSNKDKKDKSKEPREWYYRAFNRPEGCPEQRSHWARIGNRDRFVQHICAVCLLRDGQKNNHGEGSQDCRHANPQ